MSGGRFAVLACASGIIALILLATSPASAQIPVDKYVRQVQELIKNLEPNLTKDGYKKTHDPYYAKINQKEKNEFFLTLEKDIEYAIVSVCDNDCSNVDIVLFDENNNEIDMDTKSDENPVVQVTPRWTGEFRLAITVPGCKERRCTVGIAVYGR